MDIWHLLEVIQVVVWGSRRLGVFLQGPCLCIVFELKHQLVVVRCPRRNRGLSIFVGEIDEILAGCSGILVPAITFSKSNPQEVLLMVSYVARSEVVSRAFWRILRSSSYRLLFLLKSPLCRRFCPISSACSFNSQGDFLRPFLGRVAPTGCVTVRSVGSSHRA